MLHIEDISLNSTQIDLKVDGILNAASLPILKNIIENKISGRKKIRLRLAGLIHCDRCGIRFLRKYRNRINFIGLSEFLRMEIQTQQGNDDKKE